MAKLGTIDLKGASGNSYTFTVYSADTSWNKDVACVYYVSKRTEKPDGSGTHSAIYVGETEDIEGRLATHHKQECFEQHGYNAVSVLLESNPFTRTAIEEDLVQALDPLCND